MSSSQSWITFMWGRNLLHPKPQHSRLRYIFSKTLTHAAKFTPRRDGVMMRVDVVLELMTEWGYIWTALDWKGSGYCVVPFLDFSHLSVCLTCLACLWTVWLGLVQCFLFTLCWSRTITIFEDLNCTCM